MYSTYLGGSNDEVFSKLAVDPGGSAYVFGSTRSPDYPTRNALQPAIRGCCDGVVTKLSPSGEIVYSTFLGGDMGEEYFGDVAVRADGSVVVLGNSNSADFPTVDPIFGPSPAPYDMDAVVYELNPVWFGTRVFDIPRRQRRGSAIRHRHR